MKVLLWRFAIDNGGNEASEARLAELISLVLARDAGVSLPEPQLFDDLDSHTETEPNRH